MGVAEVRLRPVFSSSSCALQPLPLQAHYLAEHLRFAA